jgi:hypothetical protein
MDHNKPITTIDPVIRQSSPTKMFMMSSRVSQDGADKMSIQRKSVEKKEKQIDPREK